MKLIDILYLVVASQGFLLTFLLFLKKGNGIYLPLVIFLFLTSLDFTFQFLYTSRIILNYPHLIYVNVPFNVLRCVLIFLYVRNIYHGTAEYYRKDLFFLIPFLLYTMHYLDFFLLSADEKLLEYGHYSNQGIAMPENLGEWAFEIMVSLPFLAASVVLLKHFDFKVRNEYADITYLNFALARKLLFGVIIIYSFEILTILLALGGFQYANMSNSISYLLCGILLYLVGYDALIRQSYLDEPPTMPIWEENTSVEYKPIQETASKDIAKYKNNVLSDVQTDLIIKKLLQSMVTEKRYRNHEIRLTSLAETLDESPNNLSQVINQKFSQNFYEFINAYRVQEATELLKSQKYNHLTIESIGYDVGFKSKSTFYTAFKKILHLTPVEFKNKELPN